jgi:hypothetical protein
MQMTLMKIRDELAYMAQQHEQINGFWWGDYQDAVNNATEAQYPLMTCTLANGGMSDNNVRVTLVIAVMDKYFEGNYRNIDEIHSDCLQRLTQIKTTLKQERFADFLDLEPQISTEPFVNRSTDVCAGWAMTLTLDVYDAEKWCEIPYSFYDFENGTFVTPECSPVTVTDGSQTVEVPSGGTYICQNGGGGLINVSNSNGSYSVDTAVDLVLPDTNVNVYVDGLLSGTGTIVTLDSSEEINVLWT